MAKRLTDKDPHADREAQNYEQPIPSREFIMEFLEQAEGPLNRNQLTKALELKDYQDVEALRRRLKAMERDGQLMRNRKGAYGLVDKMDLVRGRVSAHRDGYGFLMPQEGGDDLYLNSRQMSTVFDGDEVICRSAGYDHRGKLEGVIVEVINRNTQQLVGRLFDENGVVYVSPDNAKINHDIIIPREAVGDAEVEQYVMVEITSQPGWRKPPTGRVVEVLGEHMAPGMEIDVAIRTHNIPHVWPEEAEREALALSAEPLEEDKLNRVDLRKLPFVTIDGEDARDFDDAVYCESKLLGGWRLWVAIADVSHYVQVGSALDQEATLRGNSVYFPEQVVPMLPEALSNGLCSLKPKVDRLCMVCEMTISKAGKISGYKFYEGVMHSHARLTYNKVGAILDKKNPDSKPLRIEYKKVVPHLENLHDLYKTLRIARSKRGAIDFETTETRMVFGDDRKISEIIPVVRNDAHKLIEECMLAANVAAAKFLEKHNVPALFRVHEGPTEEKLEALRKFLGELAMDLPGGNKPGPDDYQVLLSQLGDRPDAHIIQTMMLRSLRQAVYQPENLGHFGLNYDAYGHFTSPIRRYPDLLVHRAIRHVVRSNMESKKVKRVDGATVLPKKTIYPYEMPDLLVLGEQCSMTERRADDATREVVAWLKCEYLQDRVGDTFEGVISAVTGFGLFVDLVDVYVEGLVHVSALASDYYHFDPVKQRLVGERTGTSFQLGDSVKVQVARVSLDDKKIDLELVEGSSRAKRRAEKSGKPLKKGDRRPVIKKKKDDKKGGKKTTSKSTAGKGVRKRKR
ncbi:ribonuclease R [Oceanicoccus sagamiensis]|uniref:Ribonuclease R n=1 Tax=Oceanicoccus sagamiensis TaxID=716816 RepID=A0A1X9NBG9_9GAMM|nr:ribonuclease R [Oceanicoccus sagamiensis]ARN74384.1 ribonuclease R [Oceanicoccus sagamiensis]